MCLVMRRRQEKIIVMAKSICAISDFWSGRWDVEVVIELLGKKFKVFEDSGMNLSGKEASDAEGIDRRSQGFGEQVLMCER